MEKSAIIDAMTTAAQLAANRLNSARSTGPRTSEGRAASAINARKHGLRTDSSALLPNESSEEFDQFVADLREALAPVGAIEEMLVMRIASSELRLRRAAAFEVAVLMSQSCNENPGLAFYRDARGGDAIGRVVRYVSAAERSETTARHELERVQARRRGASVPVPVAVDIMVSAEPENPSER